ncbi:MAG: AzlC family ABC transporter permease [Clostridia bacterium]|nr:AzlC family ABC transporter permease [Clostridia bacterium]
MEESRRQRFWNGFRYGAPIMLGYAPVSFAFAVGAVGNGLPWWVVILISMTNFTSAGQQAGATAMMVGTPWYTVGASVFVVNIRYMLMSMSLSQRMLKLPLAKKLILANGVTDEIYFLAMKKDKITGWFFAGLAFGPYLGWVGGTVLGALAGAILPTSIASALNIALYAMFIAIVVPEVKKSHPALFVCLTAVALSVVFTHVPGLGQWGLILASVGAAAIGAWLFPIAKKEATS